MGRHDDVRVRVLGPVGVLGPDGWARPTAALRRRTLCALALVGGRAISGDRIADALWGEHRPASADKVVQNHIAGLRREFGRAFVDTRPEGYALAAEITIDVDEYARLVDAGATALADGRAAAAIPHLDAAAALWRGEPYEELAGWAGAAGEVTRMGELHREAVEHRLDALVATGRALEAVPELELAIVAEPLRERRWELLMLALYRLGRQTEALRAYGRARRVLRDELGIEPGVALRALERAILTQDAALDEPDDAEPHAATRHALAMARRGELQQRAGDERHRVTLHEAARLAIESDDDEALFVAALGGLRRTSARRAEQVDPELVEIIEAALARAQDGAVRARLLSALGQELSYEPDPRRAQAANDEALALARTTGDAAVISEVLARRPAAYGGPDLLDERLAATEENLRLVEHVDDPLARWGALYARIAVSIERGDIDDVDRCTVALRAATDACGAEPPRWGLQITEAWQYLLHGQIDAAERSALAAFDHGTAHAQPEALGIYIGQIVGIRRAQGRLLELEAAVVASLDQPPMGPTSRALTAEMLADMGRLDRARAVMDAELETSLANCPALFRMTLVCAWSTVATRLDDRDVAAWLRTVLAPHRGLVCANSSYVAGALEHFEGLLSLTLDDRVEAEARLRAARRVHERLRAPLLTARTDALLTKLG
jgi:DNA-binding SARP family transcriptional activator